VSPGIAYVRSLTCLLAAFFTCLSKKTRLS
jgi:hypothetical protein